MDGNSIDFQVSFDLYWIALGTTVQGPLDRNWALLGPAVGA